MRGPRLVESRRWNNRKALRRGGCAMVGTAAGVFLAMGIAALAPAPQAHADVEDLIIQPIIDAIDQAAAALDPGLSALDPGLSTALDSSLASAASALDSLDFGSLALPEAAAASTDLPVTLSTVGITEPVIDLAVNGGSPVATLVDSGSDGLVIPLQDIGWQTLSFPVGLGFGSYSGGLDYFYLTFDMPVSFDGGTAYDLPVDVAIFEFPTTINSFLAGYADAILGTGPDASGPGPDTIAALPGDYGEGVYTNESTDTLEFGANPDPSLVTLTGGPIPTSDVYVSIDGGAPVGVKADFDSGGVFGTMPESVYSGAASSDGTLPVGSTVDVYSSANETTLLYSYTVTNAADSPTIVSSGDMDTGYYPFHEDAIYIGYDGGNGDVEFDSLPK